MVVVHVMRMDPGGKLAVAQRAVAVLVELAESRISLSGGCPARREGGFELRLADLPVAVGIDAIEELPTETVRVGRTTRSGRLLPLPIDQRGKDRLAQRAGARAGGGRDRRIAGRARRARCRRRPLRAAAVIEQFYDVAG